MTKEMYPENINRTMDTEIPGPNRNLFIRMHYIN